MECTKKLDFPEIYSNPVTLCFLPDKLEYFRIFCESSGVFPIKSMFLFLTNPNDKTHPIFYFANDAAPSFHPVMIPQLDLNNTNLAFYS